MKNGFTLIELLAVIIIISVLATLTVITVGGVLTNSKNTLSEAQIKSIESRAEEYYLTEGVNNEILVDGEMTTCVNISYLINKGYIDSNVIKDPKDKRVMNGSVLIHYAANQYTYTYQESVCPNS